METISTLNNLLSDLKVKERIVINQYYEAARELPDNLRTHYLQNAEPLKTGSRQDLSCPRQNSSGSGRNRSKTRLARLLKTRCHGKEVVLAVLGSGNDKKRITITKDRVLQVKIARQNILFGTLCEISRQIRTINDALSKIYEDEFSPQRFAVENYNWFSNDELRLCMDNTPRRSWTDEPYEKSGFRQHELTQMTSRGLLVRSKSELLIAEMLYKYGIEFRYEQIYRVPGCTPTAADFTIRRADGKIFIWEHEGLVNSRSYLARQQRKAETYAKLGYVPWDNLIITYDTDGGNIDLRIVESIIKTRLLV